MNHPKLVFGQEIQPAGLVMTESALLHEPREAGVVRVKFEGAIEQVWSEGLERLHHRQQFQEVRGVRALGSSELARLEGDRVKGAEVVRLFQDGRDCKLRRVGNAMMSRVGRAGSHTRSTGADVRAALRAVKLCCSAVPQRKDARGLHKVVSGAARLEKPRTNRL